MASRKVRIIAIAGCVILVGAVVFLSLPPGTFSGANSGASAGASNQGSSSPATETVEIKGEEFELELSLDNASRTRGLGGRDRIDPDGGMLFVFPQPGLLSFVMRDCTTDIDLIFLDPAGYVTALHEMPVEEPQRWNESVAEYEARLTSYRSPLPAQFAIELAPGSIRRLGVRVEERITLDLARLKAMAR
jgi:uncharacterized membrane protein (UPF0127 family)